MGLGLEITELRLGLPGDDGGKKETFKKRVFSEMSAEGENEEVAGDKVVSSPAAKFPVVGWPPVCSYRSKNSGWRDQASKGYVKVSMDGVPYLRKMDLGSTHGYDDLSLALEKLFGCIGIGVALKDGEKCEYVTTYEDKDGDWMLAGDVPWQMFMESCRRMRIMKRSDATGFGICNLED
ncbi:PREDICTED: auxin-responsive protein IAA19 [Tarenaya hassleriana]|uniref:auxin-responsive protein IAA19 n=1 Tax=Tarenaya hassleriana TaxID=28532 RepID=UPI00053CA146|nr:PREDICTED: auxin-responsive protein IAA19 [Tarenaya hassleriana]